MAKKKKKMIKLNQQIRMFFGDEGFDEGIDRVPTDVLIALAHTMGIFNGTTDRPTLIRTFRRLWSESEDNHRVLIVDFFKHEGKFYPNPQPKEKPHEREHRIEELLEGTSYNNDEKKKLLGAFIDTKLHKITSEKLITKLEHIRLLNKRDEIEHTVQGKFDYNNALEFYASIYYDLNDNSFSKIHVLKTISLEDSYLEKTPKDAIIEKLTQLKTDITKIKQSQTETFCKNLSLDHHRYLEKNEIIQTLKSAPPTFSTITIPLNLLEKVLTVSFPNIQTDAHGDDLIIQTSREIDFPYLDTPYTYFLDFHLDVSELSDKIWKEEELDLTQILAQTSKEDEAVFLKQLQTLTTVAQEHARLLNFDDATLCKKIYPILLPLLNHTLTISSKTSRRFLYAFDQSIANDLLKRQRQELLARTVRDFKNLFPLARSLRRKLILHIGPTNSGKTYQAFEALKRSGTGYYLAPLRLLALEGYETLKNASIHSSLITGEEQLLDEDATHISSTIEMLNFDVEVDMCVIDEVQMIGDRDRGWAWANAIIGAPASTVIMTGSPNAKEAIVALAEYLNEPLEIVEFERKNPLELLKTSTSIKAIEPQTAVIAFTRSNALRLKQQLSSTYKTSIIYGNLSPEVRREEARRFREGETEVLVATDAISMGLNLPIKTLLFSKAEKFDGQNQRSLSVSEVLQISGRAGRFGIMEKGYVGALTGDVLKVISKLFENPIETIALPFNVMANFDHIQLVSNILEENSLANIITFFVENMKFEGPFRAINLESMQEAALIVDRYDLDMKTKYTLATAPLSTSSPLVMKAFERYVKALEQKKPIAYIPPISLGAHAFSMEELQEAEDKIKEISLYLWLSYRLGEYFIDAEKARSFRGELNRFIENSLKQSQFTSRCKTCGKPLAPNSEFSICQSCFHKLNQSKRRSNTTGPSNRTSSGKDKPYRRER